MKYSTIVLLIFTSLSVSAQLSKTIHQTFEIEDDVQSISMSIVDTFQVEYWAGNNIMAVTEAKITGGAQHVLEFYVKNGRYEMVMDGEAPNLSLTSKDKLRKKLKYKDSEVYEELKLKIYIPQAFQLNGNQLSRKNDETALSEKQ